MSTASFSLESIAPFSEIVDNIQRQAPEGLDQLYKLFRILSGSLRRQLGYRDFEDRLHDVFLLVVQAIQEGRLREPGALSGYIHGVAHRSLCASLTVRTRRQRLSGPLEHWMNSRNTVPGPDEVLASREREEVMRERLGELTPREREILTRFYIDEQPKEQICREMSLTETQFRLTKSRAKQRLERANTPHRHAQCRVARQAA